MYKAIGVKSEKVYATGSKADCFRKLSVIFPTLEEKDYTKQGKQVSIKKVYPEEITVIRER